MRRTLTLLTLSLASGCYLSHQPPDAGPDVPEDAPLPNCTVSCGPVEHVASIDTTIADVSTLRAVVTRDGGIAILLRNTGDPTFVMALVDPDSGEVAVTPLDRRPGPITTHGLTIANLEASSEGFLATALTTTEFTSRVPTRPVFVSLRFGADAAFVSGPDILGELSYEYAPCDCALRSSIFGRQRAEAIASLEGETLWLTRLDPETRRVGTSMAWASFPGAPPRSGAVQGSMFPDGRVAVVGGGAGTGLGPRDGFLAVEGIDGEVRVVPLPGERFDAPPTLVAGADGVSVFRFVSDPRDLGASVLRAETRDERGAVLDGIALRPLHGLAPVEYAAFRGRVGAGMVWVDDDSVLRVLPEVGSGTATSWSACEGLEIDPLITLPHALQSASILYDGSPAIVALGEGDGASELYVVLLGQTPDVGGSAVDVFRIPDCRLDAR
jgi:hypothetical protein